MGFDCEYFVDIFGLSEDLGLFWNNVCVSLLGYYVVILMFLLFCLILYIFVSRES